MFINGAESQRQDVDVVIVGGGITGLSLAAQLDSDNVPFVLLEKAPRFGGQIRTEQRDGYTFEQGPNTGTISSPEVMDLFDYARDCELQVANESAKQRWIWKGGRFHALPSGPLSAVFTPLFSWRDKFRVLAEPFRKPGVRELETVGELAERRLGKSFVDYAVDPFIGGIYAADPYKLVTRYALPKLQRLEDEHGSFIRGAIAKMRTPKSEREMRATKQVFSARGGFNSLVDAIVSRASVRNCLLTNISALDVAHNGEGWEVAFTAADGSRQSLQSQFVVFTVPAHCVEEIMPKDASSLIGNIPATPYAPVAEVSLGFDHLPDVSLNAFGGLVPSREKRDILGILFISSCFDGRAPHDDSALMTIFLGGTRRRELFELSDDELKTMALREVRDMLGIPPDKQPDLLNIVRYPHAIPLYDETTPARLEAIRAVEQTYPGIILAGGMRDGIGLAHRIQQGMTIGREIGEALGRR